MPYDYIMYVIAIPVIIYISRKLGARFPIIPTAIFGLITSYAINQIELLEHMQKDVEAAHNLSYLGLIMISASVFPIGLEIADFRLLKNLKFWLFISLLVSIPGGIYFLSGNSIDVLERIAIELLLFTSSLAVLAVFIQRDPSMAYSNLVKTVMMTGGITDVILWVGIGILKTMKNDEVTLIEGIAPQLGILFLSIMIVVAGKMWWWSKVPYINPKIWLALGGIVAFGFWWVGLSPVLGAIFAGLMVPELYKHRVSKDLYPIFTMTMQIYMSTVGFKVNELLSWEVLAITLEFMALTTFGKGVALYCATRMGIFPKEKFIQMLVLVGNAGTMAIAAAGALEGIIPQEVFDAMVLNAIFYTVFAGWILDKFPIMNKKESRENLGALKPTFSYSES